MYKDITSEEQKSALALIEMFLSRKDDLGYANLDEENKYLGWVSDFKLKDEFGKVIRLDFQQSGDLFLLYALAIGWSRPGPWENPVFFTVYLELNGLDNAFFCTRDINVWKEKEFREEAARVTVIEIRGIQP